MHDFTSRITFRESLYSSTSYLSGGMVKNRHGNRMRWILMGRKEVATPPLIAEQQQWSNMKKKNTSMSSTTPNTQDVEATAVKGFPK